MVDDGELHVDDGLDTETVFDLGGHIFLQFLLEDVSLDVQAVCDRWLVKTVIFLVVLKVVVVDCRWRSFGRWCCCRCLCDSE